MKFLLVLLVAVATTQAKVWPSHTAYGYLERSAAESEKRREAEEQALSRIVGGVPAAAGQYPYQAALLIDIIGIAGHGICGGSLISSNRVITAAHCWSDGVHQAWRVTVALGTVTLFSGGTRIQSSAIATHPSWFPLLVRNDIGVIYLPLKVPFTNLIASIALPTGPEQHEDFAGSAAIASGFGLTSDDGTISNTHFLSHVRLNVITNSACSISFPLILQPSNICTSGIGGIGVCRGDSGGPLVVERNNRPTLIGVTSFGSALGCQASLPSAYARVTSFNDFVKQHLN